MDIANRLSEEIINSKMPLKEIALRLNLSPALISQYKNKRKLPGVKTLARLCRLLDISSDYILGLKDF